MSKERLRQMDALRFFAILIIVLSHMDIIKKYAITSIAEHIDNPAWGVDYFFILSGFGVYLAYENYEFNISLKNNIKFAMSKVKKYYLLYFVSLVLCIPYSIYFDLVDSTVVTAVVKAIIKLGWSSTLLHTMTGLGATHYSLNSPAWFLSCIFVSYMLVPVFIKWVNIMKERKRVFWGAVLTYIWILFFSAVLLRIESVYIFGFRFNALWYSSAYIRCFYLLLGMFAASIYQMAKQEKYRKKIWDLNELLVVISIVSWFYLRNELELSSQINRMIDILIAFSSVYVFAFGRGYISKYLKNDAWIELGKDSIYVFLLHWPILKLEYILILSKIETKMPIMAAVLQPILLLIILGSVIILIKQRKRAKYITGE